MTDADLDTESRILEAAHRVFLRRGVAAARTQEIADEADVNKALLHYYFRTKSKLADAVFLRAASSMFPQMLSALAAERPLRERIQAAIEIEMDAMAQNPFLPGYILCELRSDPARLSNLLHEMLPVEQVRAHVIGSVQRALDAEAEAGRLRPTTAHQFMVALMSLLIFPYAAAHMLEVAAGIDASGQEALADWRRDHLADFILRGFSA